MKLPNGHRLSPHQERQLVKLGRSRLSERRANPTLVILELEGLAEHRYEPLIHAPKHNTSRWYITEAGRSALKDTTHAE